MLELLETPPAGEVGRGKRWLPDVKYEKYVGMIRAPASHRASRAKCQMRRERLIGLRTDDNLTIPVRLFQAVFSSGKPRVKRGECWFST